MVQFKFYVLNYDFNKQKVINYNIFNNSAVNSKVYKAIVEYLKNPEDYIYKLYDNVYTRFKGLCEQIKNIIRYEEQNRREYEISVGDAFETKIKKFEKWDCYKQIEPNIEAIVRECIYQYKLNNCEEE